MRTHPAAILGIAVFSVCLELAGFSAARADDVRPAQVLKNKGLERQRRSTSSWSLAGESDVHLKYGAAKGLISQLTAAQAAQQNLEMGGANPQALIEFYQGQIHMGDSRIAEIYEQLDQLRGAVDGFSVTYHNLLVQQQCAIVAEQRRLSTLIGNLVRQGGDLEQQRREFNVEIRRLRDSSKKAIDELSKSIDKVQQKYADASKDADITKALTDLSVSTRSKQKLGPSSYLQEAVKWLDRARGNGPTRGSGTTSRKRR